MKVPLGLDFPTDWGRQEPASTVRNLIFSGVVAPTIRGASTLQVTGTENISTPATKIFAANHVSHLDTPLVLSALPSAIRRHTIVAAAMDTFFMSAPKAVTTVLTFNAIPIERHKVNRRSAELAQRLLEQSWNLLIYPEGGRTTNGSLMDFKPGAAFLAERTGATVIPTYIHGAGELAGPRYAKASRYRDAPFQWRHHVSVNFGEGLTQLDGENVRRFGARIEEAVAELGRKISGDRSPGRR